MTRSAKKRGGQPKSKPLWVIAGLLAISAMLRFGTDVGPALAEVALDVSKPSPIAASCGDQGDSARLLEALHSRDQALEAAEAEMARREAILSRAEAEAKMGLEAVLAAREELDKVAASVRGRLESSDDRVEADIARMVSVYEAMKPKDAVALFQAMDTEFAAGFLFRMKPQSAALILAGLDPQFAYDVSVRLAGQNIQMADPK